MISVRSGETIEGCVLVIINRPAFACTELKLSFWGEESNWFRRLHYARVKKKKHIFNEHKETMEDVNVIEWVPYKKNHEGSHKISSLNSR